MGDLYPTDSDTPVVQPQEAIPQPAKGKTLYIKPDSKKFDHRSLLNQFVQYVSMTDVLSKIKVGTQYVVQIPTEYQEAFNVGDLFMMQNQKTNKMWPSLMEIAENGRHQVVTPLPCVEQNFVQGNPIQDLAAGYHNLLMQQQMGQLTELVEETYRMVEQIEHGQMDDRIGLLDAGKDGLLAALKMEESSEKIMQINSSRQTLLEARGQIGRTLKRRVEEFKAIPKTATVRFIYQLGYGSYIARKDEEFSVIQEYYDLYLQATKFIAASHVMRGDLKAADEVFIQAENFMRTIDFSNVQSIGYAHKNMKNMLYSAPVGFITREKEECQKAAKDFDYVALEVSGEELLEVLNNGRAETVSEAEAEQQ